MKVCGNSQHLLQNSYKILTKLCGNSHHFFQNSLQNHMEIHNRSWKILKKLHKNSQHLLGNSCKTAKNSQHFLQNVNKIVWISTTLIPVILIAAVWFQDRCNAI